VPRGADGAFSMYRGEKKTCGFFAISARLS
jgi:hypothetical protein